MTAVNKHLLLDEVRPSLYCAFTKEMSFSLGWRRDEDAATNFLNT